MRRAFRLVATTVAAAAMLALSACSSHDSGSSNSIPVADGAAAYCKRLATLPDGLQDAVGDPASSKNKAVIGRAATQLAKESKSKSVPTDLRTTLGTAAAALSKVQSGRQVTEAEAKSLLSLEKEVKDSCAE